MDEKPPAGWWAGDDPENMPEVVRRWMREPDPGDPPYDWRRVEIFFDVLTKLPPREFAEWRDRAGDDHDHEWRAAVGMTVDYLNDQLTTHAGGGPQFMDAAARLDELQRITMGDD